jgi:hypothetical protein
MCLEALQIGPNSSILIKSLAARHLAILISGAASVNKDDDVVGNNREENMSNDDEVDEPDAAASGML